MAAYSGPSASNDFRYNALLLNGNGVNGANNNTFLDRSDLLGGYSVYFNGSNSCLRPQGKITFAGDFTIEAWVYRTASTTIYDGIFCLEANGDWNSSSSGLSVACGNMHTSAGQVNYSSSVPLNSWTHVACTRSGSTIRAFINGSQVASVTNSSTLGTQAGNYPAIGAFDSNGGRYPITGYISNLRVITGTALYTSNFTTPNYDKITAISGTSLLTCQSSTIVDNSTNAFTINVTGTATVSSTNNTITRTGNVAQGTFSPFSLAEGQWSNYFDGTGDWLSSTNTPANFQAQDFCIECWVWFTTNSVGYQPILSNQGTQDSRGWVLITETNNTFAFYISNGSSWTWYMTSSTIPAINQWTHIVVSRTGGTLGLFINGTRIQTTSISTSIIPDVSSNFNIGYYAYFPGGARSFNGYFSNVRLVKGSSIYDATQSTITVPTAPLTAITNTTLLTCQSNRFKDNSSNNFALTVNGDTKVTAWSPFEPGSPYIPSINGGSAYFLSHSTYLSVANNSAFDFGTGDFTIEAWVNYSIAGISGQGGTILARWSTGGGGGVGADFWLGISNPNTLYFTMNNSAVAIAASTTLPYNTWNHVAIVRSGTSFKLYQNGVSVGTATSSAATQYTAGQPLKTCIWDDTNSYLTGYITDARIVKGTAVYTSNFTPPTSPLTAISNTQLLLNCTNAGIYDATGKNCIETVGDAQISTSVKKYGTGSMYFDGTGDYLQLPSDQSHNLSVGDFTVEAWIYTTTTTNDSASCRDVVCIGNNSNSSSFCTARITMESGVIKGRLSTSGSNWELAFGTTSLSINTWYHVALVRNASTFTLYVNGIASGTATNSSTLYYGTAGSRVGNVFYTQPGCWNGYIDDLRITKGLARYTSNFAPPSYPLKLR